MPVIPTIGPCDSCVHVARERDGAPRRWLTSDGDGRRARRFCHFLTVMIPLSFGCAGYAPSSMASERPTRRSNDHEADGA